MSWRVGSIRTLIPAVALLLFIVVSATNTINQYLVLKEQILIEAPQFVRITLMASQRHIEEALARQDQASVESEVFNLGVLSEISHSALINAEGKVIESTHIGNKGKDAIGRIPHFDRAVMQKALDTLQPQMMLGENDELYVYFPILGRSPHVLYVDWKLEPQIKRVISSLLYSLMLFWCLGAVVLIGLVWLLHRAITLPLRTLEAALNHIVGTGAPLNLADQKGIQQSGVQEIRSLSHAMQNMQARLQDSYTKLYESEQNYRRLFNMAQEGVWVIDTKGFTTMVNQSMAHMLEYSVEEMIGKHMDFFMDDAGRELARTNMEKRRAGVAEQHDFEWITRTGKRIYTVMQTAPLHTETGEFSGAIAGVMDITQRREAEQIIARQANYDALTQLPNRRRMGEVLEKEMMRARRHNHIGAVLFIDLDHFKNINDSLGHPIGDALLVAIAKRLQEHVRQEDTLARLGGDEFVVLLPELHHEAGNALLDAQRTAYKLQSAIAQGFEVESHTLSVTCSIGIAIYPLEQDTIHDIIRQADTAMYRSKQDGRNLVRFFTHELQQEAERTLELQLMLPKAIEEQHFEVYFQPQLDHQQRLIGAEALLRWPHAERGFISPLYFIRAAEESGLIHPLGDWVIRKVCEALKSWQQQGLPESFERVAINISPRQFIVDNFAERVFEHVTAAGVDPSWVELEITEGMLMSNLDSNIAKMQVLKEKGFYLSIDDFGTGYSCLSYLKSLPISKLKIDQSFTRDLSADRNDRSIVQTIIMMAQTLELDVLAEGVETREQFEFLEQHGCHKYQGYYFGKPVSTREFTQKWITPPQSGVKQG